jgi:hypothetical protein
MQEIIVPIETMSKHPGVWREYGHRVVFAQVALWHEKLEWFYLGNCSA